MPKYIMDVPAYAVDSLNGLLELIESHCIKVEPYQEPDLSTRTISNDVRTNSNDTRTMLVSALTCTECAARLEKRKKYDRNYYEKLRKLLNKLDE